MAIKKKTVKSKKKVKKVAKAKKAPKRKIAAKKRPIARKTVRKAAAKKTKKKAAPKKSAPKRVSSVKPVGLVTHFYAGIKVAVVKFSVPVKQGTQVQFKGATTDFSQKLVSMQYDHRTIAKAPKGKQVGVKVRSRVRTGDRVYL